MHIEINTPVEPARGACSGDKICSNSVCIQDSGEGVGDANLRKCELALIAADNFDPPPKPGTLYTGPAVAVTPTGFVIAYRQATPDGKAKTFLLRISGAGEKVQTTNDLPPCTSTKASFGVGAAWNENNSTGLITTSAPPCPPEENSRLWVQRIDANGYVKRSQDYDVPFDLVLHPTNSIVSGPENNQFQLAAMYNGNPVLFTFTDVEVQPKPPSDLHEGHPGATFVAIAASENVLATLTDSTEKGGRLVLGLRQPSGTQPQFLLFNRSSIASLTVWRKRTALVHPSGNNIAWHAIDRNYLMFEEGQLEGGPYTAVDVAHLRNHLLVAGAQTGKISVFRLDDANGQLKQKASVLKQDLEASIDKADLHDFEGERVNIAAARGRVVIAWMNSTSALVDTSTSPGGYAVLVCND
ncbi:MAG: hypothetical protein CSA75_04560 [Sorangium cellulosum]|nr:MAG: hypothetical protein CSA75_04560 [Sorangium cellulosum]